MIVREIVEEPELIENFDWFNDYDNTRSYLEYEAPEMLPEFDARFEEWLKGWNKGQLKERNRGHKNE